jgi:hypothetical protein
MNSNAANKSNKILFNFFSSKTWHEWLITHTRVQGHIQSNIIWEGCHAIEQKIGMTAIDKPQQMLCNTHWMQCTKIQHVQTTTTKPMQNGMAHRTNITYIVKVDTQNDASTDTKTCVTINSCDKHSDKCHRHNLGGGKYPPPIFL